MNPLKNYQDNFRNDKRLVGGKIDVCPLCKKEKKLVLSHVTPKWCYKWAKNEGNGSFTGNYPSLNVSVKEQDGSKHYMLCQECDQFLGDAENYIRIIMHGSASDQQKKGISRTILESGNEIYKGVDVELIQRFLLGLVLKSHYASSAPFHNIKLDVEKLEMIRDRIINPQMEDLDYPIISMEFYSKLVPDIDPKAIMIPQQTKGETGEDIFTFLIAGWEWGIHLNNKRIVNEKVILENRLCINGDLKVLRGDILLQRHINPVNRLSRKERRKLERENRSK